MRAFGFGIRPLRARTARRLILVAISVAAAACTTAPPLPPDPPPELVGPPEPPEPIATPEPPSPPPAAAAPERTPRRRPHARADRIPPDPAAVAEPVPRYEPVPVWANRPYVLFGQQFVPMTERQPFRQRGLASWYGPGFHGQRTALGERYDMYGMTAAHPTLPIPSFVRVTHRDTGRSVVVRVNDRGPYRYGRAIDLSYTAAWKLGFAKQGTADVDIELIQTFPGAVASAVKGFTQDAADAGRAPAAAVAWLVESAGDDWMELGRFPSLRVADAMRARLSAEFDWGTAALRVLRRSDGFALVAPPTGADDWGRIAGEPQGSEHADGRREAAH